MNFHQSLLLLPLPPPEIRFLVNKKAFFATDQVRWDRRLLSDRSTREMPALAEKPRIPSRNAESA